MELQPLFTLRYSATHKQLYNQIYKLDSYAAYQKDLVKKIVVENSIWRDTKRLPIMLGILHLHLILKQGLRCFHKIKVEQSDLKLLM